jgi:hypothetical protein
MSVLSALFGGQPSAAPRNYAQDLGWKKQMSANGTVYTGHYRAAGLRYDGWILWREKRPEFFILKPPIDLLRDTDYAGCFHARNDGWWLITFKPYDVPADVASGIAAIHKTLRKAFELRAARRRNGG